MEMVAHQTECKDKHIIPENAQCNIIHTLNKIRLTSEDVISLQSMAAHVKITFLHIRIIQI